MGRRARERREAQAQADAAAVAEEARRRQIPRLELEGRFSATVAAVMAEVDGYRAEAGVDVKLAVLNPLLIELQLEGLPPELLRLSLEGRRHPDGRVYLAARAESLSWALESPIDLTAADYDAAATGQRLGRAFVTQLANRERMTA